jgi:hypothetical protein
MQASTGPGVLHKDIVPLRPLHVRQTRRVAAPHAGHASVLTLFLKPEDNPWITQTLVVTSWFEAEVVSTIRVAPPVA